MSKQLNVALIGNPNTGKTSVFNALTGLNQKVGNYPALRSIKNKGFVNYHVASKRMFRPSRDLQLERLFIR